MFARPGMSGRRGAQRLGAQVVVAPELGERVEPREVLADPGVGAQPAGGREAGQQPTAAASEPPSRGLRPRADESPAAALEVDRRWCPGVRHSRRPTRRRNRGRTARTPGWCSRPPTRCCGPPITASSDAGLGEEHLVEQGPPGELAQGPHVDAGLVHVDREVGDALVLGDVGIGPGDQHARGRRSDRPTSRPSVR